MFKPFRTLHYWSIFILELFTRPSSFETVKKTVHFMGPVLCFRLSNHYRVFLYPMESSSKIFRKNIQIWTWFGGYSWINLNWMIKEKKCPHFDIIKFRLICCDSIKDAYFGKDAYFRCILWVQKNVHQFYSKVCKQCIKLPVRRFRFTRLGKIPAGKMH